MAALGLGKVVVPTRGALYGGKLPDGEVSIRKLTVGDEIILQSIAGAEMVSQLIAAATKLPQGLTHSELLTADRLAVLIGLRVFTFGKTYNYQFRCGSCGSTGKATCDLSTDIKEKPLADAITEPVEVRLNDADVTVGLRFLRGKDEDAVAKVSKRTALQSNDAGDPSAITRMALQLLTIDGKDAGDIVEREKFIRNLSMPDGMDFRDALDSKEPGIDLRVYPECKACGAVTETALPFGLEFFRPSRNQP